MRRWTSSDRPESKRTMRYFPRRSSSMTRSPWSSAAISCGSCGRVRRASALEPLAEAFRREGGDERLFAEPRPEVRLELAGLEQEPRAEAAHVPVGDGRAVVELDERTQVRRSFRLVQERSGHPQVDEERAAAREADDQVLPAPVESLDELAHELSGHLERVERPRQPQVQDLDVLERPAFEQGREPQPDRLHLG